MRGALALATDGEVVVGAGAELLAWRLDNSAVLLWTAPRPIHTVAFVDPLHVLVVSGDGKAALVDTRAPNRVEPLAMDVAAPALAEDGGLAATLTTSGALELVDPVARDHWMLAPRAQGLTGVAISPDGRRVLALSSDGLLAWTVALPQGPDATTRWLEALTNAALDHGPAGALTWK